MNNKEEVTMVIIAASVMSIIGFVIFSYSLVWNTENVKVVTLIHSWQGDNAPYNTFVIQYPNGHTANLTVSCDYYQVGDTIKIGLDYWGNALIFYTQNGCGNSLASQVLNK
jgi:hypothetical protein